MLIDEDRERHHGESSGTETQPRLPGETRRTWPMIRFAPAPAPDP